MSRTRKDAPRGSRRDRKLSVRSVRRTPPDLKKMSHAIIRIAMEQAAAEKAAQESAERRSGEKPDA
jgi:hypothetical protein